MINNEIQLDVDELYDIATRLKESEINQINAANIINKTHGGVAMNKRYHEAKQEYAQALTDFDYFVSNYIKYKKEGN